MTNSIPFRPSWVEVNLSAVENNVRRLKELIGPNVELMAMVKANAYGHGAVQSAGAAVRGGASWLGVFTVGEGLELRAAGIDARILVLGPTLPAWAAPAFENDLTLSVASPESAGPLVQAARSQSRPARVHVKINTGMTRLGLNSDQVLDVVRELRAGGAVEVEGLYTHFAVADDPDARGIPGWGEE